MRRRKPELSELCERNFSSKVDFAFVPELVLELEDNHLYWFSKEKKHNQNKFSRLN